MIFLFDLKIKIVELLYLKRQSWKYYFKNKTNFKQFFVLILLNLLISHFSKKEILSKIYSNLLFKITCNDTMVLSLKLNVILAKYKWISFQIVSKFMDANFWMV